MMRWPWVSRAAYEAEVESREAWMKEAVQFRVSSSAWAEQATALIRSYDALLEKYHALKLQGAAKPEPVPALPKREPDPVTQAVIAMAQGRPALYAHYNSHVAKRRAEGAEEAEIAKEILTGVEDDMGVPA